MFRYVPSPTGLAFHESDKYVKMLCGPYGSGKSCCCAMDILFYACAQPAASDGVRYSRVGVVRSSYPELTSMTRKSLMEVLPPECGDITGAVAPLRGVYVIPLQDGTKVSLELNLFALKTPDDCSKILSANWTFAWINEATGVCQEVFAAVQTRIGRFPPQDFGGVNWGGVIMDFNQPAHGSWLDRYCKEPEPNWLVLRQPPAALKIDGPDGRPVYEVNPNAENLRNLGAREEGDPDDFPAEQRGMRYYRNQIQSLLKAGRSDVVENQYCMLDVPVVEGKPVFPSFSRERHVAPNPLEPLMFHEIVVGMDQSGIHPAAVVLQNQNGKWCVLDELYAENEGFENFLNGMLVPMLRSRYSTCPVTAAIDPSNQRDSWQGVTPRQRLEEAGIPAVTEITNSPKARIQAVDHMLNLEAGGLLVSPACENLVNGFTHEYRYRRMQASGTLGAVYTPQPEKNDASHYQDALQYACLLIQRGDMEDAGEIQDLARRLSEKRRALGRIV